MQPPSFREILPDTVEKLDEVLPSFPSLRRKTWETLYYYQSKGNSDNSSPILHRDKSPKGSVDQPIQSLVNLINFHPSYATLSSCSGRIALYDAFLQTSSGTVSESATSHEHPEIQATTAEHHGKGGTGGWRLASHTEIDVNQVLSLIRESLFEHQTANTGTFSRTLSFEPMLLHVAASNLKRGRKLLQTALQMGFRESGLVVTDTRVTVAIRSYALAWQIPLDTSLPEDYLRNVLEACNDRLRQNHDKMNRLHAAIYTALFQRRHYTLHVHCTHSLPPLNLWGHATVTDKNYAQPSLVVFGGYGTGPMGSTKCQRSLQIYRLVYFTDSDTWSDAWEPLQFTPPPESSPTPSSAENDGFVRGIRVQSANWTGRQGLSTCLSETFDVVFVFGGRAAPGRPLQDLFVFDLKEQTFGRPVQVRGTPPSPRWGHTMTEMSDGSMVIVGGRNEHTTLSDIHMLSMVVFTEESKAYVLQWTTVDILLPCPRTFHSALAIKDNKKLWVWGGTSQTETLLPERNKGNFARPSCGWVLDVHDNPRVHEIVGPPDYLFGHSMVRTFTMETAIGLEEHFLCLGGAPLPDSSTGFESYPCAIRSIGMVHQVDNRWTASTMDTHPISLGAELDFAPWHVHHAACAFSVVGGNGATTSKRLVVTGGGVQGFAFGPMFGDCLVLEVECEWVVGSLSAPDQQCPPSCTTRNNITTALQRMDEVPADEPSSAVSATPLVTNVFYVEKRQAKALKKILESEKLLDKRFRMCPADLSTGGPTLAGNVSSYIAVPVVPKAMVALPKDADESSRLNGGTAPDTEIPCWANLVAGVGQQKVLLSSSMFASNA